MADVPGICELSLTRAVVQYGNAHEPGRQRGPVRDIGVRDIGMAVVLAGRSASRAQSVDLGSGTVRDLDLTTDLVILDWIHAPTLAHLSSLTAATALDLASGVPLRRYCFGLALRILDRRGFTPLTRPVLLRIGFCDLCRDLDLNDHASVRIATGPNRIATVTLDPDRNALLVRTSAHAPDPALGRHLEVAFPGYRILPPGGAIPGAAGAWRIHFGIPARFAELRHSLHVMRLGLNRLVAHFEPARYREMGALISTFGERATLDRLILRNPAPLQAPPAPVAHPALTIH